MCLYVDDAQERRLREQMDGDSAAWPQDGTVASGSAAAASSAAASSAAWPQDGTAASSAAGSAAWPQQSMLAGWASWSSKSRTTASSAAWPREQTVADFDMDEEEAAWPQDDEAAVAMEYEVEEVEGELEVKKEEQMAEGAAQWGEVKNEEAAWPQDEWASFSENVTAEEVMAEEVIAGEASQGYYEVKNEEAAWPQDEAASVKNAEAKDDDVTSVVTPDGGEAAEDVGSATEEDVKHEEAAQGNGGVAPVPPHGGLAPVPPHGGVAPMPPWRRRSARREAALPPVESCPQGGLDSSRIFGPYDPEL